MKHRTRLSSALVMTAVAFSFGAWSESPAAASRTPARGQIVANPRLPLVHGGTRKALDGGVLNALVFLRPGQDRSRSTLPKIAALAKELGPKVRWTALVGSRFKKADVDALLRGSALKMPVAFDVDGALRNRLGVVLEPTVVIVGKGRKFLGLHAFHQLNYVVVLRARLRHALGEIDDAALKRAKDPPANPKAMKGDSAKARRYVKMATRYLGKGKPDKALTAARKAVGLDPNLAAAHAVEGQALAAAGDCKAALVAFSRALALDPAEPRALAGKKRCQAGGGK